MSIRGARIGLSCESQDCCPTKDGCPKGVCPDFVIKRHDTKPPIKIAVDTCEGALDISDENLAVEASLWAKAKLKKGITNSDTYFGLADNIGFEQAMVGDIIVMKRARRPEHMLVTAFDEENKLIQVQRGYNGTPATSWKKGTSLRIFRMMNSPGEIEIVADDILQVDGSTAEDEIVDSFLVYEWKPNDTCLPGCYWLEFKLLMLTPSSEVSMLLSNQVSVTPSFTPSTLSAGDFGCRLSEGVEWMRRFPSDSEGFLVKITDSPTAEL